MMAFCILSGDSFKSFAIEGREVLRIVESSICIKIAVANINGRIFLVVSIFSICDVFISSNLQKIKPANLQVLIVYTNGSCWLKQWKLPNPQMISVESIPTTFLSGKHFWMISKAFSSLLHL